MSEITKEERLRHPGAVSGDKSNSRSLQPLGDVGEFVQELGLNYKPEILFPPTFCKEAKSLCKLLLKVFLLVQHELCISHHEVVLDWLCLRVK